ncbi:ERF family protein [Zhengella mangrovi]|nr:ERF family protein [Zhengella mangrovi]
MNATAEKQAELIPMEEPKALAPVTPMAMIDRALQTNASPETLEKLLLLQERYEANEARRAFDDAMANAKAEIPAITKSRKVDFTTNKGRTNYDYEDLATIASVVNPILSKFGLSYRFRTVTEPNAPISVTCIISHRMGHFEENTLMAGRDESGNKNSIQAIGSTVTYLQRYTLKAALGLSAAPDDDGKKAEDTGPISEGEAEVLRTMIEETGTDIAAFCGYMKIESIPAMPAIMFRRAVASLQAKKRKQAQEGGNDD